MSTLPELAASSYAIRSILMDEENIGHVDAAHQISGIANETVSETAVRRWRRGPDGPESAEMPPDGAQTVSDTQTEVFGDQDRAALHDKLDDLLNETNADPGATVGMRVSTWDSMTKGDDGEPNVTRMYGVQLRSRRLTPTWPVVQQADPVTIIAPTLTRAMDVRNTSHQVAVILPDPQIGYRFYPDTGAYDPFHDIKAMDVALQVVQDLQPDLVVWLGDLLDLAEFGKYEQEQAFTFMTQKTIQTAYEYLMLFGANTGHQVVLEGNHDRRLQKMITANAMAAFGLKRASDVTGWPVLSVPHLCRFDDMDIEYVGGYPAGEYWINDRLKCIHGLLVRSNASTAKAVSDDERVSTIFGHIHRIETHYRTANVRGGARIRLAHTPGCLCRIDGAVPSVHGSTGLDGRPVTHYEDWQQGLTIVRYAPGDGPFSIETAFINTIEGYTTVAGGKIYKPRV
jgi:Calcineurin-like phosphoesterase